MDLDNTFMAQMDFHILAGFEGMMSLTGVGATRS